MLVGSNVSGFPLSLLSNHHFNLSVNTGKNFCISTLFLPILASPIQDASTKTPDKVDPYAKENLEWHDFDLTSLFNATDDDTHAINARDWDLWEEIDNVKNYAAKVACIGSGTEIENSLASSFVPQVCPLFLRSFPAVVALDDGWEALQAWNQHDAKGDRSYINYRKRDFGDNPPKLTKSLCNLSYKKMTNKVCIDKGKTQGATVSLKRKDDDDEENELQIGFDPNDQNEDHESSQWASCQAN